MAQRIALVGATGRMGRMIGELIRSTAGLELAEELRAGDDLARVAAADTVVDVTLPRVSAAVVAAAVAAGRPVLVGTSGWSADRVAGLRSRVPATGPGVLIVPNFSIGSVLASSFAARAARWFDSAEIVEAHHAGKSDSPSGTAVLTAERMAAARADLGPVSAPHPDQRARGQQVGSIPVHAVRMAGVLARQEVLFGAPGEQLVIRHETTGAEAYAAGVRMALAALPRVRGVVVGLEHLLFGSASEPLEGGAPGAPQPGGPVRGSDQDR